MKATEQLHDTGQSLWLDNITRALLTSGGLERYIKELSVAGLTSSPTIFDHAIKNGHDYDAAIREKATAGKAGRKTLYKQIAQANKFGDERVGDIQRIFADTWIDKAEKGWWVQKGDGTWVKK